MNSFYNSERRKGILSASYKQKKGSVLLALLIGFVLKQLYILASKCHLKAKRPFVTHWAWKTGLAFCGHSSCDSAILDRKQLIPYDLVSYRIC